MSTALDSFPMQAKTTHASPTVERSATPSYALTGQIHAGDEKAFGVFYELWFDRCYAMARRITRRDENFCLDIVQDCMLRVLERIPRLGDEAAVTAWMSRVVFTTAIDRLRSDQRRAQREQGAARDEVDAAVPSERKLEEREELEWLAARLAELPVDDQRLILERFAHDKTLAEVGASIGITVHAAHGRLRRILLRLRERAEAWL